MTAFAWTCPFCNRPTTITGNDFATNTSELRINNKQGYKVLIIRWTVCPNEECKEFSLRVMLYQYHWDKAKGEFIFGKLIKSWNLIPSSEAKVFPSYVPEAIRNDYEEACLIKDLSPKASATLLRRCLQGMVRDFWGIKKKNLKLEIDALKDKVDKITWKAIDAVRSVGNIGAHMEKDINLIIDVDQDEASTLIGLIETLIKEWYIQRREKEEMLNKIIEMKEQKESIKKVQQAKVGTAPETPNVD